MKKFIQENGGSFDKGILVLADLISSNKKLIKLVNKLGKLRQSSDDNFEEIYETEIEIFNKMIELSGLFEINSLHADDINDFKEKLTLYIK